MKAYLDAREIAQVAHDAVYRAWFGLSGSKEMSPWDSIGDGPKRDARDAVSGRMRTTYQNERIPTSIPTEYGSFWKRVVDAAIELSYDPSSNASDE